MLNHIILMGRMTRDPEESFGKNGKAVVRFTLAVDRDRKDESGKAQTDFIDCVCFGKTGEFVSKYFCKGRMAIVDGRLQVNQWEDEQGEKRKRASVVAQRVYFGDSKKDSGGDRGQSDAQWHDVDDDDDMPF